MSIKSIKVDKNLANKIKARRNQLGLTIEEAAKKAGVGIKTWCRYESGEAIRYDKYKGVCKALNLKSLTGESNDSEFDALLYCSHEAWSPFLAENFGKTVAAAFTIGSETLLDEVNSDLSELSSLPKGSHLGQLDFSFVVNFLPRQFLMDYDYEFLYLFRATVIDLIKIAKSGNPIVAHTVLQEIVLYIISLETDMIYAEGVNSKEYDKDWVFDLFDDMDIITFLYSEMAVDIDNPYHFTHWNEHQFYI